MPPEEYLFPKAKQSCPLLLFRHIGRSIVMVCATSLLLTLSVLTYEPLRVGAQTVSDCVSAVNNGQRELANEECLRTIMIISRARWRQGGSYCDNGCEHSLNEIPDQSTKAEEQLAYSELAECQAVVEVHFGHLAVATYWLEQAVFNSKGLASFAAAPDPTLSALAHTAQQILKRQVREQAYVKSRMVAVTPVQPLAARRQLAVPAKCNMPDTPVAIKGSAVEPEYSDLARKQGAVGTTDVKVTLNASGGVSETTISRSLGNDELDRATTLAARSTNYIPARIHCIYQPGSYIFESVFIGM